MLHTRLMAGASCCPFELVLAEPDPNVAELLPFLPPNSGQIHSPMKTNLHKRGSKRVVRKGPRFTVLRSRRGIPEQLPVHLHSRFGQNHDVSWPGDDRLHQGMSPSGQFPGFRYCRTTDSREKGSGGQNSTRLASTAVLTRYNPTGSGWAT